MCTTKTFQMNRSHSFAKVDAHQLGVYDDKKQQ